jgi:hypothetical protein
MFFDRNEIHIQACVLFIFKDRAYWSVPIGFGSCLLDLDRSSEPLMA